MTNVPLHQVLICGTRVPFLLLQFWRCAPEENVLVQDQFNGGEDVEGIVHHQDSRTRCQEILLSLQFLLIPAHRRRAPDLQSLPIPTQRWKDLLRDYATGLPYLRFRKDLSMGFATGSLLEEHQLQSDPG